MTGSRSGKGYRVSRHTFAHRKTAVQVSPYGGRLFICRTSRCVCRCGPASAPEHHPLCDRQAASPGEYDIPDGLPNRRTGHGHGFYPAAVRPLPAKLSEGKSEGYARWAKRYNLKEMSKTLIFLQENKIGSIEEMQERVDAATAHYHELGDSIKASEKRLAEIAVLKAHIINYAKTRPVYDTYLKTGYSKRFLEMRRTEITLHKAAKAAFDESNLKTLPKVKELDAEYSKLLTEKKARYPDYRKAKEEMQELLRAKRNVEMFFAEKKSSAEKMKSR